MLTTAPHLYIRRPSPTTAEFTVTTCPPLTLPLRLLLLLLSLSRLALFSAAALTLYGRFLFVTPNNNPQTTTTTTTTTTSTATSTNLHLQTALLAGDIPSLLTALLQRAHLSAPGAALSRLLAPLPASAAALLSLAAGYAAVSFRPHTTESVLVLRGLGIQTCSAASPTGSRSGLGRSLLGGLGSRFGGWATQTRFIPTEKIRDVLINEAFWGFGVRYCLIVVVEGEEDVVVLFPGLLPRRKIVEAIWRGVRGCLFEGGEVEGGKGE